MVAGGGGGGGGGGDGAGGAWGPPRCVGRAGGCGGVVEADGEGALPDGFAEGSGCGGGTTGAAEGRTLGGDPTSDAAGAERTVGVPLETTMATAAPSANTTVSGMPRVRNRLRLGATSSSPETAADGRDVASAPDST